MAVAIKIRSTVAKLVPNPNAIRQRAHRLLSVLGLTRAELSILLTDDSEIKALNAQYRGIDRTTDVLSFPMQDETSDLFGEW